MTTRLIASSLAAPQKISVNTTFSKPLDSTGPFYVQPGLTSKNVLATVNLKSIGDVAAANTTLMLPKASTDYTFKTASGAVTISTKAVGTTKAVVIASLDLTPVQKTNGIETGGNNTPSVQFTDLTAKFHYVSAVAAIKATKTSPAVPAVAAHIELTSLKLANDNGTSSIDGISNDGLVNLASHAVATSTYSLSIDGGKKYIPVIGTSFKLENPDYAAGSVKIIEKDAKGVIINATTNANKITIDKVAPAAHTVKFNDTGSDTTDGITTDGTVTISNTEANAKLTYSLDGGAKFVDVTGNTFVLPDNDYADKQIIVKQTDTAGNETTVALDALTVDQAVSDLKVELATDTGISDTDGITYHDTVIVSNDEPSAEVEFSTDSGKNWTPVTDHVFTLNDGKYEAGVILVKQTDVAGNESKITSLGAVTIDTTADDLSIDLAEDTGSDTTDGITSVATVIVSGLEVGATWQYSVNGLNYVDGKGTSFDLPADLTYGKGDILVRQTDKAGNVSEVEGTNTIDWTLDSTADVLSVALAKDTGSNIADGITSKATVNVTGLEVGATWQYSVNGANFVDGMGSSFDLPADGTYKKGDILVRQIDKFGNETRVDGANSIDWTLDTKADDLSIDLAEDTGSDTTDGITSVATVIVSGLEVGATWQYRIKAGDFVNGTGTSFDLPEDDTYNIGDILVRQVDKAGNESEVESKNTMDWTLDSRADDLSIALAEDLGSDIADGITNKATVNVIGLEDGATWKYSIDGNEFVDGTGKSFDLPADGTYQKGDILVRQIDTLGNETLVDGANSIDWTLDTEAKAVSVKLESDPVDGITTDGKVTVTNVETDSEVKYSTDKGTTWFTATEGVFTVPDGKYAEGDILVSQIDAAGNESQDTALVGTLFIDSKADDLSIALAEDMGSNIADGITSKATVNVTGLEVGATWQYSVNGASFVDGTGASFDLTADSTYGKGEILVRQTDKLGNVTRVDGTNSIDWTLDRNAPNKPTITLATDTGSSSTDRITNDGTVTVSGFDTGAVISYSTDGGLSFTQATENNFILNDNNYATVLVKQTDLAGNDSETIELGAVTVDSNVNLPSILLANGTGLVTVTDIESGADIFYSVDGGDNFSMAPESGLILPAGTYAPGKVVVKQTDLAGNSNSTSNADDWSVLNGLVPVKAANAVPFDASNSNGDFTFSVEAGDYTFNIANFDALDKLQFPAGGSLSLVNNSFNDNAVTLEFVSSDNKISNIVLTNLSAGTDAKLWSTAYTLLNDILGSDTVTLGSSTNTGNSSANSTPSNVVVDGLSLTGNALVGNVTFNITAGSSYNYTIDGFANGDKLSFPTGGSLELINTSFKDASVVVEYVSSANNVVDITLTGLTSTQESALWSTDTGLLNSLFTAGTVIVA